MPEDIDLHKAVFALHTEYGSETVKVIIADFGQQNRMILGCLQSYFLNTKTQNFDVLNTT